MSVGRTTDGPYEPLDIFEALDDLLKEINVSADISIAICEEISIHFARDVERLYAIHHEYLHPTKAASYLAFWVRKLKPISKAFRNTLIEAAESYEHLDLGEELKDINEQLAIHLALRMIRNAVSDGVIAPPREVKKKKFLASFGSTAGSYLSALDEFDAQMGSRFQSIVYDMRFRTFGPHHLTNVLTHFLREVRLKCEK